MSTRLAVAAETGEIADLGEFAICQGPREAGDSLGGLYD
jgi:hypothetical protein